MDAAPSSTALNECTTPYGEASNKAGAGNGLLTGANVSIRGGCVPEQTCIRIRVDANVQT